LYLIEDKKRKRSQNWSDESLVIIDESFASSSQNKSSKITAMDTSGTSFRKKKIVDAR